MRKIPEDVWGYKHSCAMFTQCPLCYGCRAYDPSYYKCRHCEEDYKKNICNRSKHTPAALRMMIRRPRIVLP